MLNYENLVTQGRAKAFGVPWSNEELEALLMLEKERKLSRTLAADYIRNGIKTLEDFDKATKKEFVPLTIEEAKKEAEKIIEKRGKEAVKRKTRND